MVSNSKKRVAFRAPVQQRSRESLARIYDAVNALLREKNFDQVTMAELSKRANVTIGSIYQRFGSKDELLWVMYGAYLDEATKRFAELLAQSDGTTIETRVENLIGLMYELFSANTGVVRSLLIKHRQDPNSVPDVYRDQIENAFSAAETYLSRDGREPYSEMTIIYAVATLLSMIRELILFQKYQFSSPQKVTKAQFTAYLKAAVMGVLTAESP